MSKTYVTAAPRMNRQRNIFKMPHSLYTTMDLGKLYPIGAPIEVCPGDTVKDSLNFVCRVTSTFAKPVFDTLALQVHAFFVPLRLLQTTAEQVFTLDEPDSWTSAVYSSFATTSAACSVEPGTVWDYLGLPVYNSSTGHLSQRIPAGLNVLPARAFAMIWNEWFRPEWVSDKVSINMTSSASSGETPNNNSWGSTPSEYGGQLPNVSKVKDIFTTAVKNTQKGVPQYVLGGAYNNPAIIPVTTIGSRTVYQNSMDPMRWGRASDGTAATDGVLGISSYNGGYNSQGFTSTDGVAPINLGAPNTTVNELRLAFALQRLQEVEALGGRYREWLWNVWKVQNGDARMQIPEYLGGCSVPLNISQIAQTSGNASPSSKDALGLMAGYSVTGVADQLKFTKSFTEPGYIMFVGSIKISGGHTYQQGVQKLFTRKNRTDFYNPLFANLGYSPIYKSELFADAANQSTLKDNTKIFGYQEPWYEYRFIPNQVTGGMRTESGDGLDIWHFADYYTNAPLLHENFVCEDAKDIDRCLTVGHGAAPQFLINAYWHTSIARAIPLNGEPGLIDH